MENFEKKKDKSEKERQIGEVHSKQRMLKMKTSTKIKKVQVRNKMPSHKSQSICSIIDAEMKL